MCRIGSCHMNSRRRFPRCFATSSANVCCHFPSFVAMARRNVRWHPAKITVSKGSSCYRRSWLRKSGRRILSKEWGAPKKEANILCHCEPRTGHQQMPASRQHQGWTFPCDAGSVRPISLMRGLFQLMDRPDHQAKVTQKFRPKKIHCCLAFIVSAWPAQATSIPFRITGPSLEE